MLWLFRVGVPMIGRVKTWLAAAGAVVLAIAAAFLRGRAAGKQSARTEAIEDEHARMEAGRDAVRDGRSSGDDPERRIMRNDRRW